MDLRRGMAGFLQLGCRLEWFKARENGLRPEGPWKHPKVLKGGSTMRSPFEEEAKSNETMCREIH